ncbi:MAG: hypothetical protein ACMG6E_02370, partial [Candidatus Roizmanbacteria bacterium]
MGCNQSVDPNPTPENMCGDDDVIGQQVDVPNSCFFSGTIGVFCPQSFAQLGQSNQYCFGAYQQDQALLPNEWTKAGPGDPCGVCSSCNGITCGNGGGTCLGSCGSACSFDGFRQRCQRALFLGDNLKCCRRSKQINSDDFCFDADDKLRTCPPAYRGFQQQSCVAEMAAFCSNDAEEPMAAIGNNKWTGSPINKDCVRYVSENAGNKDHYGPVIEAMVRRYLITQNKPITSIESDGNAGHDPFIDTIVNVCRNNAGACDPTLKEKCQGVTREQLSSNVNLANLCGCFLEDIEYAKFSGFGVKAAICDPVCTIGTSVKKWDQATTNPAKFDECKQSLCIIDDVTINVLANSNVGDITFSQACGNCAKAGDASC